MGNVPPELCKGITLEQALDELFKIAQLLDGAGIEHGGYGLLELHKRVLMLDTRHHDHIRLMKQAIIRAHRAEDLLRQVVEG